MKKAIKRRWPATERGWDAASVVGVYLCLVSLADVAMQCRACLRGEARRGWGEEDECVV